MTEVAAVEPAGRISGKDLGLWSDEQIQGLRRLTSFVHSVGGRIGIQLAHAGRKAKHGGTSYAPSAIAYDQGAAVPTALTEDRIRAVIDAYRDATVRADAAGFDVVEIHAAHGYLLHEFLAPIANTRTDRYGGAFDNRIRFPSAVARAVRDAWPDDKPLLVRTTATDLVDGGVTTDEGLAFGARLKALGADLLEVSSGNITPGYPGTIVPGYQVGYAASFRRELDMPTAAVGLITSSELAESVVAGGAADLIFLGRALLRHPFWLLEAARAAGVTLDLAIPTYARATGPYERGF